MTPLLFTPTEAAHIGEARALGRGCGYAHARRVAEHGSDGSFPAECMEEVMPNWFTSPYERGAFREGYGIGMQEYSDEQAGPPCDDLLVETGGTRLLRDLRLRHGIDA